MKPLAPDGGWGWMVVLAYFLISVITDGIRYSFGVMLISLVEAFGKGSGETAWVGGLMAGTCNLSGKFVRLLFLKTIPSQYTVSCHHRPASETPFKWKSEFEGRNGWGLLCILGQA